MKKYLRRLLTALIISASGFFGTAYWYNSGKGDGQGGDRAPVARLNDATNEVQRKPVKRVIWESVNRNDELFPGEAIRTAPNADAKLYFLKSHTTVHLEPDSLVVLEENDNGLSLDFLQGNMFVQSSGGGANGMGEGDTGITLKTGNGEIKLKSADMSLSKSQNGNVALEVHRGEAQLAQGGKNTALNKENSATIGANGVSVANDRVQMLRPQAGDTLYLNLAKGEKVDLAWKPLPAGYKMSVEVGSQRNSMSSVANASSAGEAGQLAFTQKPGQWYLRLVATSDDPKLPRMASTVIPFTIEPKTAPSLIEPRQEASVLKINPDMPTAFKWVTRHKFSSQVLEIANDPQFKNVKTRETLPSDSNTFSAKLDDGAFFWRVTGFLKIKDKSEPLTSTTGKFTVASKFDIKPPVLTAPQNELHLSYQEVQKSGVIVKWQPSKGVEDYHIVLERKEGAEWKKAFERDSENTQARLGELKSGTYRWTVASVDPRGGENKPATPWTFTVEDMERLEWVQTTPPNEFEYHSPTPSIAAKWKPLATPPAIYRYRFAAEGKQLSDEPWHTTRQALIDSPVPADGKYQIVVEALNAKGQMYAQSEVAEVVVHRKPLLPAPQWASNTPPSLKSDGKGNLTFGWNEVQGAQHYLMVLESEDGKVVDQKEISRTTASLSRLKPGQYQVHLKSIDDFKRPGLPGEKKKLEVPNASDIRAPKIKAMKVK